MSRVPKQYITPDEYLRQERKAEFRSEYLRGDIWKLTSCQGLDGKIQLEAIECELITAEVYDKVVFV